MTNPMLRMLKKPPAKPKPPLAVLDNAALLEALRLCRDALCGQVEMGPEAMDALDSLLALEHPGYAVVEAHEARERKLLEELSKLRPKPVLAGKSDLRGTTARMVVFDDVANWEAKT